jgi:excisionase family DNA binding protein
LIGGAVISFRDVHGIADELGVDVQTVRRWIQSGKLKAFKPGKEYRVREADLEEFLAAREVRPKAPAPLSPGQPDFNGLLEEDRRLRLLAPVSPAAIALNAQFAPKVKKNDVTIEQYEQVGEAFARLDRLMADAVSSEYIHSEEASEAVLAEFNRAWLSMRELRYTLQRAHEKLKRREGAGVTNLKEYRQLAG